VCLHRGISFCSTADSPLRRLRLVGRGATALNQFVARMAQKSQHCEVRYRVSVHGTPALGALPSFHTPIRSASRALNPILYARSAGRELGIDTGFSYTASPGFRARLYREAMHAPTGGPYTEEGLITGESYTEQACKCAKKLTFLWPNCTKPSCTNHNNRADVLGRIERGVL
jgi:hypothetical protein